MCALSLTGRVKWRRYPCLTDKNCAAFSYCNQRRGNGCYCRDELFGNGETTCKRGKKSSYTITPDSYAVAIYGSDGIASKRKWSRSSNCFSKHREPQPGNNNISLPRIVRNELLALGYPCYAQKNSGITSGQTLEVTKRKGMLFSTSQKDSRERSALSRRFFLSQMDLGNVVMWKM